MPVQHPPQPQTLSRKVQCLIYRSIAVSIAHIDVATTAAESSAPTSVAFLLSQLQASSSYSAVAPPPPPPLPSPPPPEDVLPVTVRAQPVELPRFPSFDAVPVRAPSAPTPSSARTLDLRACTFQQALPHIAALSEDPAFMKKEQADLERRLWDERCAIRRTYEEKVKLACTKAKMIGSGLTQYEADTMSDSFRRDLKKFDTERALVAWDGLVTKQQTTLETLGVPSMFPSASKTDRELSILQISGSLQSTCHVLPSDPNCRRRKRSRGHFNSLYIRGICAHARSSACRCSPPYLRFSATLFRPCTTYAVSITLLDPQLSLSIPMPYVDLVSKDDYASIWYITNTPNGNVGSFDPSKPTIVMLHPLFLDLTWMYPQMEDHRLYLNYNIILFDTRATGKSIYRHSGRYDLWVAAADLAFAFHYLNLPPAHIFAPEIYGYAALRLASLFPELCLSVTVVNIPGQTEIQRVFDSFDNLVQLWCYAEDLLSFEHACKELLDYFVGTDAHPDLIDEIVAYWEKNFPPFRRSYCITNVNILMNRSAMNEEELASITSPVLIVQAERSATHPIDLAELLVQSMVNVPGGATIFPVKTSVAYMSLLSASIVNQVFIKFLQRLPHTGSNLRRSRKPIVERMKAALQQLAKSRNNPSIAERDPLSPLSFSCLPDEAVRNQDEVFMTYIKGEREAFSPLTMEGRPIRKYSERNEHWLDAASDGYSYSISTIAKFTRRKGKGSKDKEKTKDKDAAKDWDWAADMKPPSWTRRMERREQFVPTPSEPLSEELLQLARIRRATINPGAVDKHVIKGSMAKVVSGGGTVPLPRMLR
ncbi:Alpha/Beta hydrolase protein [Amylocystis lapponica]|nr:Alpha/Beta hydrolase protein [Amylocystis lapponica]